MEVYSTPLHITYVLPSHLQIFTTYFTDFTLDILDKNQLILRQKNPAQAQVWTKSTNPICTIYYWTLNCIEIQHLSLTSWRRRWPRRRRHRRRRGWWSRPPWCPPRASSQSWVTCSKLSRSLALYTGLIFVQTSNVNNQNAFCTDSSSWTVQTHINVPILECGLRNISNK